MFWPTTSRPSSSKEYDVSKSRHRRSASDLAHLIHSRREAPSVLDLQSMVRLSGKSSLYLPSEYAPCALILPTCIRATAQYVAQNADTRGIFRIPGSMKVVSALFDYYCHMDKGGGDITGTVRSATLPLHIQYSVHDIASTLKRLLSTLPGGILGSLLLFDSFIAIQSQLHAEPEFPRTNQTKVRARLIALAIGTIESQYRRELICALFGLLSMIGRIAELAPREDDAGLPLPTTDLMGYGALSICFGPLLVGDLLQTYTMKIAALDSGLLVLPPATQQVRRDTRRTRPGSSSKNVQPAVDKILIANRVTEMLISNWRDIVRQMKSLGTHRRRHTSGGSFSKPLLRPSASETFLTRLPRDFPQIRPNSATLTRNNTDDSDIGNHASNMTRPKPPSVAKRASGFLKQKASVTTLSPTLEESPQAARSKKAAAIAEEQSSNDTQQHTGATLQQNARYSTVTEGTQTENGMRSYSPTKRKRFTVPPRLSSIDSLANSLMVKSDQTYGPNLPQPEQKPKSRANSGEGTPPKFYSPTLSTLSTSNCRLEEVQNKTPNGKAQENLRDITMNEFGSTTVPGRLGAQSPATDSKYQLKRYKRRDNEQLTGSPSKSMNLQSWKKSVIEAPRTSDVSGSIGSKNTQQASPIKANGRKLRRAKSGPMRNLHAQVEDDIFRAPHCAPVGVWRNGVPQKSPMAKVIRSSVSDGVSLRASAIRSLINAGKSRIRNSHTTEEKIQGLCGEDYGKRDWEACLQGEFYPRQDSWAIIRHLNLYHRYSISPEYMDNSEAATGLSQIILSLHNQLVRQNKRVNMHRRGQEETQLQEMSKLRQDVGMWRRRAESAEKRTRVFEKFTERLKDIRDATMASDQIEPPDTDAHYGTPEGKLKLDKDFVAAAARVRFAEVDGNEEQSNPWQAKEYGMRPSQENERSKTCSENSESQSLDDLQVGNQCQRSLRPRPASFDEVAELWMAAKELLDMDPDG